MEPVVEIAGRKVGVYLPCFVVAEAGVNHNGDTGLARELVLAAKEAGADCVKFQTFRAEAVATRGAPKARYQLAVTDPAESQLEMLRKLELSPEAHSELMELCAALGVMFLSTPYGAEEATMLDRLGVPAFKVASGQIVELDFLEGLAQTGKPIILSTGMASLAEVERAVSVVRGAGGQRLVLLQCTTNYPSAPSDANLRTIETMRRAFAVPVGYSDHTPGIAVATAAVALGACIVEKHLTLDRSLPGPDHYCSATPREFAELVRAIREVEVALGSGIKEPAAGETPNIAGMRRSIVAAVDIQKGVKIERGMLVYKRPGTGISPARLAEVVGREVVRTIRQDTMIGLEDLR